MKHKLSKYNYFQEKDADTVICMNLVDKSIFGLSREKYNLINNSENIDHLHTSHPAFFSALKKLGLIVEDSFNETKALIVKNRREVYNTDYFRLTVMPTLECNFNCWYCYENRIKGMMTEKTINSIIKFVKNHIKSNGIKHFQLDWFGGEPLLGFENAVYPISKKIKSLCKKNNIYFTNMITTNGFLINKEMIKKCREIGLNSFQITLDGNEEAHNKVKKDSDAENVYKKTIGNIIDLIDGLEKPHILLRINYTKQNSENITDIINDIDEDHRKKIEVSFQQVWQTEGTQKGINIESCNSEFETSGFNAPLYKLDNKHHKCYADLMSQMVINFDGKVFKCTARDFAESEPDGILTSEGTIDWNNVLNERMSRTTIENERCLDCELLPACWGPCSQKVIECKPDEFNQICNKSGIEKTVQVLMNDFYKKNILNSQ